MTPDRAVAAALAELPDADRQALLLSRAGMTFVEVADRLGEPVDRVRARATAALQALTRARLAVEMRPAQP